MKRSLRRAVSLLCVLAMCLSLLPTTAWASGDSSSTENGVTISNGTADNPVTASDNGVTVNKYLSGSGTTEDPYKLTLEGLCQQHRHHLVQTSGHRAGAGCVGVDGG